MSIKKLINFFVFPLVLASPAFLFSYTTLNGHYQLLKVTTDHWDSMQGTLEMFERQNEHSPWMPYGHPIPVVLGINGLAVGQGLPCFDHIEGPHKKEGDRKSPAGLFTLGSAFGMYSKEDLGKLSIDYFQLMPDTEAVDDLESIYYNRIVNRSAVDHVDWKSSEIMYRESLYELGLVVNHNTDPVIPGNGSAIFLHLWRHANSGTYGCTAMDHEHFLIMLKWLDDEKKPLLLQLPQPIFDQYKDSLNL